MEGVVLVSCGAFCPPHRMHIEAMHAARRFIESAYSTNEEAGHDSGDSRILVFGYFSPSRTDYVRDKLARTSVTLPAQETKDLSHAEHRAAMLRLATADCPWLDVSTWECNLQEKPSGYPAVTKYFLEYFQTHLPECRWRVMLVCGADLALRAKLYKATLASKRNCGCSSQSPNTIQEDESGGDDSYYPFEVIAVGRRGTTGKEGDTDTQLLKELKDEYAPGFYFVEDETMQEASSTEIRNRIFALQQKQQQPQQRHKTTSAKNDAGDNSFGDYNDGDNSFGDNIDRDSVSSWNGQVNASRAILEEYMGALSELTFPSIIEYIVEHHLQLIQVSDTKNNN